MEGATKAVTSAGSIKENLHFAFTFILKRLERMTPGTGHKEKRGQPEFRQKKVGGKQMIEIATVRNELDRTSGKLKDFRGSL